MTKAVVKLKGGAGSGHHGHAGRPGKHGGSLPGKGTGGGEPKARDLSIWTHGAGGKPRSISAMKRELRERIKVRQMATAGKYEIAGDSEKAIQRYRDDMKRLDARDFPGQEKHPDKRGGKPPGDTSLRAIVDEFGEAFGSDMESVTPAGHTMHIGQHSISSAKVKNAMNKLGYKQVGKTKHDSSQGSFIYKTSKDYEKGNVTARVMEKLHHMKSQGLTVYFFTTDTGTIIK